MKPKIIINGASGKMGSITAVTLKQHPEFELLAQLDRDDDLPTQLRVLQPDLVVDFTNATAAFDNARIIIAANIRPIIGTSGLTSAHIAELQHACKQQRL